MFLELVDILRCPRPHELQWLVAAPRRMVDRDIIEGELGCPVCGARYPIANGIADLRAGPRQTPHGSPPPVQSVAERSDLAVRAAAFLDLTTPNGIAVLAGAWAAAAHEVAALDDTIGVLAIDPPTDVTSGFGVSVVLAPDVLPVRPASVRAVALDPAHALPSFVSSSVDALMPNGRLVAPAGVALPPDMAVLAGDDRFCVASKLKLASLSIGKRALPHDPR